MPIIDTHVHYNLPPLSDDWPLHWQRAQAHDVIGAIVIGVDLKSSQLAVSQANKVQNWYSAVGIHPESAQPIDHSVEIVKDQLTVELGKIKALTKSDQVIALGECGLDYFRLPNDQTLALDIIDLQKWLLHQQLTLAKQLNLPLIIHLRDKKEQAYWDFIQIYRQTGFASPFVLHCVSGPLSFIKQALDLGAYIGIDGNITYPQANDLRAIVKMTPPHRVLLETDAPYLPPVPHRGKTCLPEMIELTGKYLKLTFGLDLLQILENTTTFFPAFKAQADEG